MSEASAALPRPAFLGSPTHASGPIQKAASALIADEGVVVFRLARLREALGERWGHKRQQVWEFIDRFAKRILGSSDVFMRINEIEYLLSCPGRDEGAAQAVAFRISEQTYSFFLGEAEAAPAHDVVSLMVAKDEQAKAHVIATDVPPPPASEAATQFKGYTWRLVPIRTIRGRELEVRCRGVEVIPISGSPQPWLKVEVQIRDDVVGQLLEPSERLGLDPEDLLRIDTIALDYAAGLVRARPPRHAKSPVMVEISIRTTALQTRQRLQALIAAIHPRLRKELKLELVDIGQHMPPGRISEAVGLLQGHVDEIIPRTSGGVADLDCLTDRRWPAVAMLGADVREALRTPTEIKAFRQLMADLAPNLIVHDEGFGGMDLWLQIGATHISGHEMQEIYVIPD
ncbi:MAG TPA: hypothetical protein VHV27_03040 [Phenylobacterium sp.]|nr:hypothetical protein [Phenylobacterium sp.]